ncbi:phage tail sheath family protein [Streptomyces longispororuber]|uniref:phage tail sheath family protein n=1 Tax=Streptomyces longispororuber TaxID=68230 RepID=UPI00210C55B5|nr:phage tail sheath C-terminal domain-containing protein [Streptomyces longispororuber]MCQ4211117.1 phage tail sheath subtilisin-like domain-containing protein [Streptomyces longispororuber]
MQFSYPGVYIEELESPVRPIVGAETSVTAFVGPTLTGPTTPTTVESWDDFESQFGGLWRGSELSYAVYQFFLNGGAKAIVVRVGDAPEYARVDLGNEIKLKARAPGAQGNDLKVTVTHDATNNKQYALVITAATTTESYDVTIDPALRSRWLGRQLETSQLVQPDADVFDQRPDAATDKRFTNGRDGTFTPDHALGNSSTRPHTGLAALADVEIFNLLVIPAQLAKPASGTDNRDSAWAPVVDAAVRLCEERRAMLLLDPPFAWETPEVAVTKARSGLPVTGLIGRNAAVFFPKVQISDPLGGELMVGPAGTVAGVIARTDTRRGVWKAPAGTDDGGLLGVRSLAFRLTDQQNGSLNKLGVNCLRTFPVYGNVQWGARTCRGADAISDPWKYIPARRVALHIEESLFVGTKWVVFEPNDEPLWSSIRLNVGAFMNRLFRQGAFQGRTAKDAYFVRCDAGNNPQADIDQGIVTVDVGFQPLSPAEFVHIRIQQKRDDARAQGS